MSKIINTENLENNEPAINLMKSIIKKYSYYNYDSFLIKNLKFFYITADKIFNIIYKYKDKVNFTTLSKKVQLKTTYSLTQDFLNKMNIPLSIEDLIKNNNLVIKSSSTSEGTNLIKDNKNTILFSYNLTIADPIILLHEILHFYNMPPSLKRSNINDYITEEISYAYEYIFAYQLIKIPKYKIDVTKFLVNEITSLFNCSDITYYIFKILYVYNKEADIKKENYLKLYPTSKQYNICLSKLYKSIISETNIHKYVWLLLGISGGIYLYQEYLKDNDYLSTIEKLNTLILKNDIIWQDIFNTLNLKDANDLINNVQTSLDNFLLAIFNTSN